MNNNQFIYRLKLTFFGVILIGIGVAFLRGSGLGTDPFTMMNLGISKIIGISLGVFQLKLNLALFFIVLILGRKYIGIGTITNMVLVGFISDLFSLFISNGYSIEVRIILTVLGIITICLGVSIYSSANFGVAPYDAIGWVIEDVTNHRIKFKISRIATDTICVIIGLYYGSIIGVNTFIMVFCTGPLVQFFTQKISNYKLSA